MIRFTLTLEKRSFKFIWRYLPRYKELQIGWLFFYLTIEKVR